MPINYRCPHCGAQGVAEDQYAGQSGPCAACGQTLTMPAAASVMSPPPSKSGGGTAGILIGIVVAVGLGSVCVIGILIALLLPAIQAAREAARRNVCANNMRQIELAMHTYHDQYNSFPPAYTVDENGQPLHSWRVLLLPYLEQAPLYDQIALDEPWDSPANRQFHDQVMAVYTCPSSSGNITDTNYMVVVGEQTLFPPGGEARKIEDVSDGTSNTIMLVEVNHTGVNWMDPTDLQFDAMQFAPNSGPSEPESEHPSLVQVGYADGSVQAMAEDVSPDEFKAQLTVDGGELVARPW